MTSTKHELKNDIPAFYLETEDTARFLDIFQYAFELMHQDITDFINIIDYEKAREKYLDMMLIETGWITDIPMSLDVKRKIVKVAEELYALKGTKPGLIKAPKYIMGLDIELFPFNDGFQLNANSLGETTILGHGGITYYFAIVCRTLSDEERLILRKITDFMRWGPSCYDIIEQPV